VEFVTPEQTEIRITSSNNFSVDISWLKFEGNSKNKAKTKVNDGPYILALASTYYKKLKFGNFRFKKRKLYYLIEANCYQTDYGTLEIRLYLSQKEIQNSEKNLF
jgi:hypothetical protein